MQRRHNNPQNSMYLEVEESVMKTNKEAYIYLERVKNSIVVQIALPSVMLVYYISYWTFMQKNEEPYYDFFSFANAFYCAMLIGNGLNNLRYLHKIARQYAISIFQSYLTGSITSFIPFIIYILCLVKSQHVITMFNQGQGFFILLNIIKIALLFVFTGGVGKFYFDYKDHLCSIHLTQKLKTLMNELKIYRICKFNIIWQLLMK
jgi:hypothetical protein